MLLAEIVAHKRDVVEQSKWQTPLSQLMSLCPAKHQTVDFAAAIRGDSIRLIAEVKRASPSKGAIRPHLEAVEMAMTYARSGAAAVSVLTEERYFHGSLDDLANASKVLRSQGIPSLRKDFLFDPYQLYESRAHGADAVLLIAAILGAVELQNLLELSHQLNMQCLVEVHDESDLEKALGCGARIIGVNNRDLDTLSIDLNTTRRLCPLIPSDRIVVSESGIRERDDVRLLADCGVHAILVGEALVSADNPAAKIKELL